jgi:hypothetical protein
MKTCIKKHPLERLLARFEINESGCWLCDIHVNKLGYSAIQINKKMIASHRLSYRSFIGEIPDGLCVLHRCDTRNCINPEHLFLGTQADNIHDMVAKNRQSSFRILTEQQVAQIKTALSQGQRQVDLARQYGVREPVIYNIKHNILWKRVEPIK